MNNFANSSSFWFKTGTLVSLFVLAYAATMVEIFKTWINRSDYSHGALVPFVALYLAWEERFRLRQLVISPNLSGGLIVLAISGLILLLGTIGGVVFVQQFSLLMAIPGLVWLLFGTSYLKHLTLPLVYLPLMVPVLDPVISRIRWPFQLVTAKCSGIMLKIMGIPVFQSAQYLELPNITLEVADICSGVNFFVSLIAVAVPLAFLTQRHWKPRLFLLVFAIIIGVVANIVRVTLIGIWAFWGWSNVVHGPLHIFQGLFVSVFGFISLFIVGWVMSKGFSAQALEENNDTTSSRNGVPVDIKHFNRAWAVATLFLAALGGYLYLHPSRQVMLAQDLNGFPLRVNGWKGFDRDPLLKLEGADAQVSRVYKDSSGHEVYLYIAYLASQRQGRELIYYTMQPLYKGAEEMEIASGSGPAVTVNKSLYKKGDQRYLTLFWYHLDGKIVASRARAKLQTALGGILEGRTNGAFIMVSTRVSHGSNPDDAFQYEATFAREILPFLRESLP